MCATNILGKKCVLCIHEERNFVQMNISNNTFKILIGKKIVDPNNVSFICDRQSVGRGLETSTLISNQNKTESKSVVLKVKIQYFCLVWTSNFSYLKPMYRMTVG